MRKLMLLLSAVTLWIAPAGAAQGPFGRPSGPAFGRHIPGVPDVGDPFGRPSGIPGKPGQFDPFGRPRSQFDPTNPLNRPGLPGRPFPGRPGLGLPGDIDPWPDREAAIPRPGPPGRDIGPVIPRQGLPDPRLPPLGGFGPVGAPVNPSQDDKDRYKRNGLGVLPHIPRILHGAGPEFRGSFKTTPASELALGGARWGGKAGGGLLAGIGAAIAGLFRKLVGCNKDKGST
jgi:hypothetical protein